MAKYVKVPVFPVIKYMSKQERNQMPAHMKPISFMFGDDEILVDGVVSCERSVSRKVGGRGFRYECKVSWRVDDEWRKKISILWYDDFLQEWFVEAKESKVPDNWDMASQLNSVGEFLDD